MITCINNNIYKIQLILYTKIQPYIDLLYEYSMEYKVTSEI